MSTHKRETGPARTGFKTPEQASILPRLLTVRTFASAIGLREQTVYGWLAARRIPFVRIGRSVRIPADALAALVANNTIPAREGNGR